MKLRSWWFEIILIFGFPSYTIEQNKCLNSKDIIVRKRNFYVGEEEFPIQIEYSKRVTHELASYIFEILLKEVIGYPDVKLVRSNPDELVSDKAISTLQKITNCDNPRQCHKTQIPEVMINLEVWLAPNFNVKNWVATGEVEDCGPLGPIGRSGWFIPKYAVRDLWQVNHSIIDHWRAFTNMDLVALFDLSNLRLESFTITRQSNTTYCNDKCDSDGVFRPLQCRHSNIRCATLLAGYPESYTLLTDQIENLGLLVNVAWVGENLLDLIKQQIANKKYVVYFHENPTLVSNLTDSSPVSFPPCEEKRKSCKFDTFRMEKIAWSKIKTNAPLIFHTLRSMSFSQSGYIELLGRYNAGMFRGHSVRDIACNWIRENYMTWDKWVPDGISDKTTLYIGGIFPLSGVYWRQAGVIPAAQMAVDAINRNSSLLPEYELALLEKDGHCTADEVMMSFIDYVTNSTYKTMVGILGPACSDTVEPIAGVAKHFSTIIISYAAEGSIFSDREKFPFFRTIPENSQFQKVYLKLFQHLKWGRIAALTEEGQKYSEYISHLQNLLEANGMTFIVNRKFPRERSSHNMETYLESLKAKNAKIIIGDFYDHAARAVMCDAYKLGMTAAQGYQWFLPLWFTSDWFDTDLHNSMASQPYDQVPCTTEEMIEAINGHMSLAYKFYADDDDIMQEGKTVHDWMKAYKQLAKQQKREVSRYGGYAYDAVWVYASALNTLLKENDSHVATLHTPRTSGRLAEIINGTTFNGVSGPLKFRGSSRSSEIVIWQWLKRKTYEVGVYRPTSDDDGPLEINESKIIWLTSDSRKPGDGSSGEKSCSVEGFRRLLNISDCEAAIVIINVIVVLTLVVLAALAFGFFKQRYDVRMKITEVRMKELGLMASNGIVALDEWEMPRDRIIINRKLGEGAFGTVYGGDALIPNKKGWVAVAVKTLKVGAKTEEKLDFLGEAEVMKKFSHMNIVQLIGVCTMGEPVYTVMEFMLYGDLKTFLLGRRNLVTEVGLTKCDEVSDKKLTKMALDVARGLSYLADLKYVHRDLACRNCLVTSLCSVKIGDFGMCRAMYDSDYYRFNRRGLLPVRWMAPESLTDGIFTPMSDVWSYGVLLYEIITFGSFPYQGLSNNQVLDYVKKYNTLDVPKGCKVELEHLLQKCWSKNSQERLQAAEIVEILASEPELISPCLDMPMASVEVEDSNSLDLTLHDRSRVHSVSSIWQHRHHVSAPDTTLNDGSDPPQILITVENGALSSQAAEMKLPRPRHWSTGHSANNSQKGSKKEAKEPKFEKGVSANVYQITYL